MVQELWKWAYIDKFILQYNLSKTYSFHRKNFKSKSDAQYVNETVKQVRDRLLIPLNNCIFFLSLGKLSQSFEP